MTTINFNNKSLVFVKASAETGRTSTRQLMNTSESGETVSTKVELTETIQNKSELALVNAFVAKARQAMLKFTTPGPKGYTMRLLANEVRPDLETLVKELRAEGADLNNTLTVCHVDVDCCIMPVDITLDSHTADRIREHVQSMLTELGACITAADMATTPTQRYSKARAQYYACQHLVSWVSGINADLVRAAIDEAGERCIDVKSTPPSSLPSLEAAIALFAPVDVENAPQFAELPF